MDIDRPKPSSPPAATTRLWPKVLIFVGIIAAWYGLSYVVPLETWLLNALAWIENLGSVGPLIFVVLYLPCCMLLFPDVVPNAAAGAIWGVGLGAVVVSIGRVFGSAATFLLVRKVAGGWIERRTAGDPQFSALADAVGRDGFRLVTLLRLCPLFPVIMLNYALGLTRVTLWAYMAGTLVGMIPRTLFVAYLGAGARSVADIASGNAAATAPPAVIYWAGLVLSLGVVVILAYKARRLIGEATRVDE
ncbi:MAG: TVP38/TMEM64 family protein [Candidatus Hydrogenedentota bacterium]